MYEFFLLLQIPFFKKIPFKRFKKIKLFNIHTDFVWMIWAPFGVLRLNLFRLSLRM